MSPHKINKYLNSYLETTVTVGKDEAPAAAGRRRRIAIAVVAVVGLVVTYAMADLQPTGQLLTEVGATDPWMLAHWTIMIVSVMWSLTAIGLQDAWLWRHSPPGPTRVGFGMMVVGTALGNLYFIHKAYYLAARNLGVDHGLFIDRFSEVGVAIFVVSLLLCTLGSFWNDVREMRGAKQSLDMSSRWRLRHLWRPLQAIADRNVVPPAGGGLLYQRIIQIMDVLAEVRAYVDQPTYAAVRTACVRAAGSAAEADVLTLAACIEVARQVKAGHRATDGTTSDINLPAGDELYDQLHALLRVARVMRRGARIVEDLNRPGQGPALTSLPQVSS